MSKRLNSVLSRYVKVTPLFYSLLCYYKHFHYVKVICMTYFQFLFRKLRLPAQLIASTDSFRMQ